MWGVVCAHAFLLARPRGFQCSPKDKGLDLQGRNLRTQRSLEGLVSGGRSGMLLVPFHAYKHRRNDGALARGLGAPCSTFSRQVPMELDSPSVRRGIW